MVKSDLLRRAKHYCEDGKYRFTQPRERVLSLLIQSKAPMGAYQILEYLSSNKEKINPPTVYRAIEFWTQHGFIHRVESMNAYIVCCEHKQHSNLCVFICNECQDALELKMNKLPYPIANDLKNKHMTITGSATEIYGRCGKCYAINHK